MSKMLAAAVGMMALAAPCSAARPAVDSVVEVVLSKGMVAMVPVFNSQTRRIEDRPAVSLFHDTGSTETIRVFRTFSVIVESTGSLKPQFLAIVRGEATSTDRETYWHQADLTGSLQVARYGSKAKAERRDLPLEDDAVKRRFATEMDFWRDKAAELKRPATPKRKRKPASSKP